MAEDSSVDRGISRRVALSGMALGAVASTVAGILPAMAQARPDGPFRHGVASGDPDATSVVLWTRVTTSGEVKLRWQIAQDLGFTLEHRAFNRTHIQHL